MDTLMGDAARRIAPALALIGCLVAAARADEAPGAIGKRARSALGDGPGIVRPVAATSSGPSVTLPPLDVATLLAEDERSSTAKTRRIGIVRPFDVVQAPRRLHTSPRATDGLHVWAFELRAPGAVGLRLRLRDLDLPPGASVIVYDADEPDEAYGPWTGRGPHGDGLAWTSTVFGERIRLELRVPAGVADAPLGLTIGRVAQWYASLDPVLSHAPGKSVTCHTDVACDPAVTLHAKGVARFSAVSGGSVFGCTGSLVADLDDTTEVPWFATANHCAPTDKVARSIECFWDYRRSACSGSPSPALATVPRTLGAALVATRPGGDFSLLRLTGQLPQNRYFAGWSSTLPQLAPAFSLHHPSLDVMKVSRGSVVSRGQDFLSVSWQDGVTEPGSSGAPLYDAQGKLIGVLSGGAASCENPAGLDVFGRFDRAFTTLGLARFLGGSGLGDPFDPADDFGTEATVLPMPADEDVVHAGHTLDAIDVNDWFEVPLLATAKYRFRSQGVGAVRGWVYDDAFGLVPLAWDNTTTGDQPFDLTFKAKRSGTHWIKVRLAPGVPSAEYTLHGSLATPAPAPVTQLRGKAKRKGPVVLRWKDRRGNATRFEIEHWVGGGWLHMTTVKGNKRRFRMKPGPGNGHHRFRVGASNVRGIAWAETQVDVPGWNDDPRDPGDDTAEGATVLDGAGGELPGARLSGTDLADWYAVDLLPGRQLMVWSTGRSDVDVEVFLDPEAEPEHHDRDGGPGRNFRVFFVAQATARWWVRVRTHRPARNARYGLAWEITPPIL